LAAVHSSLHSQNTSNEHLGNSLKKYRTKPIEDRKTLKTGVFHESETIKPGNKPKQLNEQFFP